MTHPSGRHGHNLLREIVPLRHVTNLLPLVEVKFAGEDEFVDPVAAGVLLHYVLRLLPRNVVAVDGLVPEPFPVNTLVLDINQLTRSLKKYCVIEKRNINYKLKPEP